MPGALVAPLPVKGLELLVRAFIRRDLLREPGVDISFDELVAQVFAPAGVTDRASASTFVHALQSALARAAHRSLSATELGSALDAEGMPRGNRDAVTAVWASMRQEISDAVSARVTDGGWRPTLASHSWSVQTETANSAAGTAEGGEPAVLLELAVSSTEGSSSPRIVRVEARKEVLSQALGALAAARRAAGAV
jgi:hypothetical protein